jgi:hypothetical protein
MRIVMISAFVAASIVIPPSIPIAHADPQECRDATDQYKKTIDDVSQALKRYTSCVADSKGHDDCSAQFRRLRSAQDDFKSAVSIYQRDCK